MNSLATVHSIIKNLPGDPDLDTMPREVKGALFSRVHPTSVSNPQMIAYSDDVANLLNLDPEKLLSKKFTDLLAGNSLMNGMTPFAMNYGGHQFGHWAGQLGDGRAITLCELMGRNNQTWEIQLKGAGTTPYSRSGDGRAVLRSSVREFLCSEAMHHLNIPTTRALSLVLTGDTIIRDMFYDGNPEEELGAIVCRVAPSFLRFGNFQLPSSRGELGLTKKLLDFTLANYFKKIHASRVSEQDKYKNWFFEVCQRTAFLVSEWMRVGFVHGVLNTDNMSITGLTIDYGPYGWIDNYDPNWTPNTTDADTLRYRFADQEKIAHWNLYQLARSLVGLFQTSKPLEEGLEFFKTIYQQEEEKVIANKLGFKTCDREDKVLMSQLYGLMETCEIDMTIFFRKLISVDITDPSTHHFAPSFYDNHKKMKFENDVRLWLERYCRRTLQDPLSPKMRTEKMTHSNPKFILRNYIAQEAIDLANQGDYSRIHTLLKILKKPYEEQPENEHFFARRPEWANSKPGCSMLSCSS